MSEIPHASRYPRSSGTPQEDPPRPAVEHPDLPSPEQVKSVALPASDFLEDARNKLKEKGAPLSLLDAVSDVVAASMRPGGVATLGAMRDKYPDDVPQLLELLRQNGIDVPAPAKEYFDLFISRPQQEAVSAGETKQEGIPLMITKEMRQGLADLGWSSEERRSMTPARANEILRDSERPQKGEEPSFELRDTEQSAKPSAPEKPPVSDEESLRQVEEVERQINALPDLVRNDSSLTEEQKNALLKAASKVAQTVSTNVAPSANIKAFGIRRVTMALEEADRESAGLIGRFVTWDRPEEEQSKPRVIGGESTAAQPAAEKKEPDVKERKAKSKQKVHTARPGQKGTRTSEQTEPLKSLADLGPALAAAQKDSAFGSAPEAEAQGSPHETNAEYIQRRSEEFGQALDTFIAGDPDLQREMARVRMEAESAPVTAGISPESTPSKGDSDGERLDFSADSTASSTLIGDGKERLLVGQRPALGTEVVMVSRPDTHAEQKAALNSSVSKLQEFAERAGFGVERTAMLNAEKAYLAKHRDFFAKNNVLSRLYKRNVGAKMGSKEMAELKRLKKQYDEKRIAYDEAVRRKSLTEVIPGKEKMDARLHEKYERLKTEGKLEKGLNGVPVDFDTFRRSALERREERSMYRIRAKEILNRAGKQVDARAAGLNEKGLELWDRVPNLLAKGNAALEKRFGKNGARMVKALGVTSFVVGGAAVGALGGAAVLSGGALLGLGGVTLGKKLLASALVGPLARSAARVVYDRTRGASLQRESKTELGLMDKDKGQLTAKRLAEYDTKRIRLSERASGEYQKRERGWVEFAATLIAGGTTAALVPEDVVERTMDSMPPDVRNEVEAEARELGEAIKRAAADSEQAGTDAVERTAGTAGTVAEVNQLTERAWHAEPLTVTLDKLEGADHLFVEMRQELLEQYPDEATRPPAVEQLLEANHPNALSREFGFAEGERSLVMQEGDSFSITREGELVFVREGQEPVTLLEANGEKPEGFVPLNERDEFKMMGTAEPAEPRVSEAVAIDAVVEPQATPGPEQAPEESPESSVAESAAAVSSVPPGRSLEDFVAPTETPPPSEVASDTDVDQASPQDGAQAPGQSLENFVASREAGVPETQTIHESIRELESTTATIPQSPAAFDGYPHESFTNNYDLAIDPSRAGVYTNADGGAFVFGGDYEQMRQAAEAFARENPGTLVTFEDRPHLTESGEVERSAARLLSDERGRIVVATYEENRALIDQVPNPYTFVTRNR